MEKINYEKSILVASDIANDLLYYGYGFKFFMTYPLTQSIGEEKCKQIWNEATTRMANA